MPVEQLPGFMDYLQQGLDKFGAIRQQQTENKRADTAAATAKAQANAGLMAQLYAGGAVGADQLQGSLAATGVTDASGKTPVVMKSKAERRQAVIAQGQGAVDALSDAEKEDLGFKTTTQKKIETAAGVTADVEAQKGQLLGSFLQGNKLTDQQRSVLGLEGDDDRELKRVSQLDPYLGQLGERYVAGEIIKTGRIPPGGAKAVSEQAYANYVSERATNGLGSLTPEQVAYTRSYFERATQNALIAQHKLDIEAVNSQSDRIRAEAAMKAVGGSESIKWFTQVNSALENVRKAQSDLMRANPALGPSLDNPELAKNPMVAGALARYQQLEQTAEAFKGAQGALAAGNVPGNLPALLGAATQIMTKGAPPPAGGARQQGPPPSAGAVPPGPNPTTNGDPIESAAQMLARGQGTPQQLQALVAQGALTQEQLDKITKRAAAIAKSAQGGGRSAGPPR